MDAENYLREILTQDQRGSKTFGLCTCSHLFETQIAKCQSPRRCCGPGTFPCRARPVAP